MEFEKKRVRSNSRLTSTCPFVPGYPHKSVCIQLLSYRLAVIAVFSDYFRFSGNFRNLCTKFVSREKNPVIFLFSGFSGISHNSGDVLKSREVFGIRIPAFFGETPIRFRIPGIGIFFRGMGFSAKRGHLWF